MMQEEYKIITEKFLQCIPFVHEDYHDSIFWGIDKQVIRQKKLNRVLGKNEQIFVGKPSKDIEWVFNQDLKNKYFLVDYNNLWSFFEKKYGYNYQEIKDLFDGWLKDTDKLKQYTSVVLDFISYARLKDTDKFKQYTSLQDTLCSWDAMEDTDKFKQYTK
jgi:hypothetical protein